MTSAVPLPKFASLDQSAAARALRVEHRGPKARIVYALTSQGRGHSSRVSAMADALDARGHELLFCAGGEAGRLLASQGREVVDVPVLRHLMHDNQIRLWTSLVDVGVKTIETRGVIDELVDRFQDFRPDLLITDFESYSVRAAQRMGLPLMCFNHQQVLTHTRYEVPSRYAWDAWVARLVINTVTPKQPQHVLLSSFFYPPLRDASGSTLVPPILREAVRHLEPRVDDHVLVYHNDPTGLTGLLETMKEVSEHRFVAYNFEFAEADRHRWPNVEFKPPDVDGFLADLASAKAVVSTAGFTLISEALYLGKPLLVMPNGGIFEQTLNALYLERENLGEACMDRAPTPAEMRGFLARARDHRGRRPECMRVGNDAAVECIEGVLAQVAAGSRVQV